MAARQLWMLVFVAALCVEAVSSHAFVSDDATHTLHHTYAVDAQSGGTNAEVSGILSAADGPRIACGQQGMQQTARHLAQANPQNEGPVGIAAAPKAADHKPLFPVSGLEVAVLVIAGVVLFIAAGAGMGGGPVLVPLYLVAGLNNTAAVALSNSTILAGSVGNTLVNIFKRHPYKSKPMIDWDLVLLMEPPTLIGAIAGSYINKILPAWITSVLLVLLLALMTIRVTQRAARIYKRETVARREEAAAAADPANLSSSAAATRAGAKSAPPVASSYAAEPAALNGGQLYGSGFRGITEASYSSLDSSEGLQYLHNNNQLGDDAGVSQLLAAERAAHVGPSDQPSVDTLYNNSASSSTTGTAGGAAVASQSVSSRTAGQQQWQVMHALQQSVEQLDPSDGARPLLSPFARPCSPAMGRADSAPNPLAAASPSPVTGSGRQSGYASPYRGTLSTVPSSVLLNLELEGNISEAALQMLGMLEISQAGHAVQHSRYAGGVHIDAVDASLASLYGIGSHHGWQQQQQQVMPAGTGRREQQQQQQVLEEPPSEAECRLAYAPPDHTRRDSWELAWEEEQQEAQQQQQQPASSTARSASAAAGQRSTMPTAARSPGSKAAPQAVPTTAGAATAAAGVGGARLLAPAAPAAATAGSSAAHSPGSVELSSVTPAAATARAAAAGAAASVGPTSAPAPSSSNKGRQNISRDNAQAADGYMPHSTQPVVQQKAPEVAAAAKADAVECMLAAESAQVPLLPAALLLVMFLAVLLTSLLSKQAPCGSAVYWIVQWAVAPILMGVFWFSRRRVLAKVALKKQAQLDFHGEVRWTPRKSLVFPAICSMAGIIAGMFGLGGAVVKTPLMLELGVHPAVTAATTQTMLLLTSSAASIVYAQLGDTPWDWAAVMLPMAFAATLAGQAAIDWLVKKVGRSSMVVLVLSAFFIVATCLSIYTMSGAARAVAANPALLGQLGKICK